jgi:hypothetical protein
LIKYSLPNVGFFQGGFVANLDLRPLSLGEILDRTFSLHRNHFWLFTGIIAIPNLLVLAFQLVQTAVTAVPAIPSAVPAEEFQARAPGLSGLGITGLLVGGFIAIIVYLIVYLFAQGGTVFAVSELYLGRTITIGEALKRMRGQAGNLFGVTLLNGLVIMVATLFLIIPGVYMACRLVTTVPAALLEDLGPRDSLTRSYSLTKDFAGRAFVIYLLYFFLLSAAAMLLTFPFSIGLMMNMKHPENMRIWMALSHVGGFLAGVLVTPFFMIATCVFYYDLRVRKEAFDLQLMMNPSGQISPTEPGVARSFS